MVKRPAVRAKAWRASSTSSTISPPLGATEPGGNREQVAISSRIGAGFEGAHRESPRSRSFARRACQIAEPCGMHPSPHRGETHQLTQGRRVRKPIRLPRIRPGAPILKVLRPRPLRVSVPPRESRESPVGKSQGEVVRARMAIDLDGFSRRTGNARAENEPLRSSSADEYSMRLVHG